MSGPPLPPPGFVMDGGSVPPPPPGFTLDSGGPSYEPEPRVPIGVDPRTEPDTMFTRDEWAPAGAAAASALGTIGMMQVGGPVGRVLASPVGAGLSSMATGLLSGQSAKAAALEGLIGGAFGHFGPGLVKALTARLAHKIVREAAAKAAPAAVEAVAEAAPAVERVAARAYQGIPSLMKVAAPVAEDAAAVAGAADATKRAASLADLMSPAKAAPVAKAAVSDVARVGAAARAEDYAAWKAVEEKAASAPGKVTVPRPGTVKPATVYSRPKGAPPARSEADRVLRESGRRNLREEQLAAAKAAGVDIGEAFGGQTQQAAESALETRLRASVLMNENPTALANEIEGRVMAMGKAKPEKIAEAIQSVYGLSESTTRDMVAMILKTHGVR